MMNQQIEPQPENGTVGGQPSWNSLFEYAAWSSLLVPVAAIGLMCAIYLHLVLTIDMLGKVAMSAFFAAGFGYISGTVSLFGMAKHRSRATVLIAGFGLVASAADTLVSILFFLMSYAVT
jgi:hypothetical protein